jgi:hypothetical protein
MTFSPPYLIENQVVLEEPWCKLHTGKDLESWSKDDEIKWNQTHRQTEKYKFYIKAFDFITDNKIKGDYFEFGCHRGRTFRMALTEARHHNMDSMSFLAFDSFAGLPENKGDHGIGKKWNPGELVTTEKQFMQLMKTHALYLDRIKLIPGFYNESLTELRRQNLIADQHKASFICVDCDLFESAVPVFTFLEDFLQEGTVIYIDDYWAGYKGNPNKGVSKAFTEFQNTSNWKFTEYLDISWLGKSFIVYK